MKIDRWDVTDGGFTRVDNENGIWMLDEEVLQMQKEYKDYIAKLEEMLQWYIDEDEINEGDPENQYWIEGKYEAIKLLEEGKRLK